RLLRLAGASLEPVSFPPRRSSDRTTSLGFATVDNVSHSWTLTATLAQGTYGQLNATATDEASNSTNAATAQTVQVDTSTPAITFDTVSFTDTGVAGDHITNNGLVTLSGTRSEKRRVGKGGRVQGG